MKSGIPPLQSTRFLDQVRERIRYAHYKSQDPKSLPGLDTFFICWSAAQAGGMRHPWNMRAAEAAAFLSMLANERKISTSDVSTTMIYTHVLKVAAGGTASPLDLLALAE